MQPADYQTPLTRWSHTWRVVAVLFISGLAWSPVFVWQWEHNRLWFFSDFGIGVASFVLMFWRRRFPLPIAIITAAASAVSGSVGGPATLALVSLSTRRRWREIVPAVLVTMLASFWFNYINPTASDPWILITTAGVSIIGVSVGWGLYIGSRRELLYTLRDRADRAESEQAARLDQARTAERSRIAREMHDVLAHRISLVSMHAGALSYRTDLSEDQIRKTAGIIQDSSHQALTELREVLGILRDGPGDAAPELPQPSACDIPALVEEARSSGMKVTFNDQELPPDLPDNIGRAVFRIVQEGLTNARKHATDTSITISMAGSPGNGVTVSVRNPLRIGDARLSAPASGLGLIGLAERTALAGGRLSHSITPDREFLLRAWLPWPA